MPEASKQTLRLFPLLSSLLFSPLRPSLYTGDTQSTPNYSHYRTGKHAGFWRIIQLLQWQQSENTCICHNGRHATCTRCLLCVLPAELPGSSAHAQNTDRWTDDTQKGMNNSRLSVTVSLRIYRNIILSYNCRYLTAVQWPKTRRTRLTSNWNNGERSAGTPSFTCF